uniref:Uncharacterized protein n=1 Tax=Photorhabdus asymbiotica subsp. asymbiotica (strain ATCC 43949 / 3105-77) TaxID=553480 RepID=B6VMR7_PHOAA|nr:Hypothetical protein PA-RVA14-1071 [Photorhabdus asymbiotica subsp. asymbiotica ATCC 43949]CAR67568.1 Hypothetical protein PA-RVA15-17-0999 [Photorhabdus asymbiotica subsp. asymbiotica ATCC 43949]
MAAGRQRLSPRTPGFSAGRLAFTAGTPMAGGQSVRRDARGLPFTAPHALTGNRLTLKILRRLWAVSSAAYCPA